MDIASIVTQFLSDLSATTWYEYLAVGAGIISVWYSRKENILVFPVGLINTVIFIFISLRGHLPGEASVNIYYTVMSIVGWYNWGKTDTASRPIIKIAYSTRRQWIEQLIFFVLCYALIYYSLLYFKDAFFSGAIPWADSFASATAFIGMWQMTKKKVESWYWWIATNIASIPLYFVKHYVFTSVYYLILLLFAVWGLKEWIGKLKHEKHES